MIEPGCLRDAVVYHGFRGDEPIGRLKNDFFVEKIWNELSSLNTNFFQSSLVHWRYFWQIWRRFLTIFIEKGFDNGSPTWASTIVSEMPFYRTIVYAGHHDFWLLVSNLSCRNDGVNFSKSCDGRNISCWSDLRSPWSRSRLCWACIFEIFYNIRHCAFW